MVLNAVLLDEEESVVSKWEKLLKRIRRNPKAVRFNDVAKILEHK